MCSAPKMPQPDPAAVAAANKKPQFMHNPWLDSLAINGSGLNQGRNDLVIAPGTGAPVNTPPAISQNPGYSPGLGVGGGGISGPLAGGGVSDGIGLTRGRTLNR